MCMLPFLVTDIARTSHIPSQDFAVVFQVSFQDRKYQAYSLYNFLPKCARVILLKCQVKSAVTLTFRQLEISFKKEKMYLK